MAAAVVPSRARAAARPPNPATDSAADSTVTYVRMTLVVDSLHAPALPAGQYYFRWMRAGKLVKRTSARPLPAAAFAQKMALYASVKRQAARFVSDNEAEPLLTDLQLIHLDPSNPDAPAKPVATAPFDVAHYLALIVDHGHSKSLSAQLNFATDISANITLSVKVPGGGNLAPVEMPKQHHPAHVPPDDEAIAAAELERLRRDARDARALNPPNQPSQELAALKERIQTLEQQKSAVEREKADAERKVLAHVNHAAKIKATYNQLAGWYNNLRQEHAEYQRKHPSSSTDAEGNVRELPSTIVATHDADVTSLEKERDELRAQLEQERSEKNEIHAHNSELLESRARTLAELRDQWNNAQVALVTAQKTKDDQAFELRDMREKIEHLRSQLAERDNLVNERSSELSKTIETLRQVESSQEEALRRAREEAKEDAMNESQREIKELHMQNNESSERMAAEVRSTHEEELQIMLSRLREEHKQELSRLRTEVETEQTMKFETELNRLRTEGEEAKAMLSQRATFEEQEAMVNKLSEIEKEKEELKEQLHFRAMNADESKVDIEKEFGKLKEAHEQELDDMNTLRRQLEQELSGLREELSAEKSESVKALDEERLRSSEIEKELGSVRDELDALKKYREDAEVSARDAKVGQKENEEFVAALQEEVSTLQQQLSIEKGKRVESEKFITSMEGERMEMRAIASRLLAERDDALADLDRAREAGQVRNGPGDEIESESLVEERDKAIRELFRVRKGLNKEVRRLKKENAALVEQVENGPREEDSTSANNVEELTTELGLMQAKNLELEEAFATLNQKHDHALSEMSREREDLQKALQEAKHDLSTSFGNLEAKEKKISELLVVVDSSTRKVEDLEGQCVDARREQNEAHSKANLLRAELESLKESLATAASSSSSAEALLTESQREAAESKAQIEHLNNEIKALSENKSHILEQIRKHEMVSTQRQARLQDLEVLNASVSEKLSSETEMKEKLESRLKSVEGDTIALKEAQQRLQGIEAQFTEQEKKLVASQERVKSLEASEEVLRKESQDTEARKETVSKLEAELVVVKSQLEGKTRELESEVQKRSASLGIDGAEISALRNEKDAVAGELAELQFKYASSQEELRVAQETQANIESVLKTVQEKATRLGKFATEKTRECNELTGVVAELRAKDEGYNSKYASLEEEWMVTKRELSELQKESSNLKGDKMSFAERIKSLEEEIGTMNERISFMQEEHDEEMATMRSQNEKETRRASEARKEIRTARGEAESLQAELERLRASNVELRKARESMKENGDGREAEVLNDLINTRMQLAYAQEETIRLRNKLKKVAQSSTGSHSFEY